MKEGFLALNRGGVMEESLRSREEDRFGIKRRWDHFWFKEKKNQDRRRRSDDRVFGMSSEGGREGSGRDKDSLKVMMKAVVETLAEDESFGFWSMEEFAPMRERRRTPKLSGFWGSVLGRSLASLSLLVWKELAGRGCWFPTMRLRTSVQFVDDARVRCDIGTGMETYGGVDEVAALGN